MLDLRDKLRRFAEILSSNNTVTITTKDREGNVWSAKVFYADKDGYVYSILEDKGHTLRNVRENPEVFFVIENGNPIRFVQGRGTVEILGPTSSHPEERSLITARNFPIVPFLKANPDTTVVRIRPTEVFVTDMSRGFLPRFRIGFDDKTFKVLREVYPRPSKLSLYVRATRPWVIFATVSAVIIGTLLAGKFDPVRFFLTLIGAVLVHLAVNASSDFFDYLKGADRWDTLGSSRVLVDNLLKPKEVLILSLVLYALALASGLILFYLLGYDPRFLYLIGAGFVLGFFYAFVPVGWKYLALGDVAVFLAWSLIATGAYFVQTGELSLRPFVAFSPVALLIVAILQGNNMRDIRDDIKSGYRTFAALIGPSLSRYYYAFLVISAYVLLTVLIALKVLPIWTAVALLTLPEAVKLIRWAFRPNYLQAGMLDFYTAQLQTKFATAVIVGLLLDLLSRYA